MHRARAFGELVAVKIQYPGVAESGELDERLRRALSVLDSRQTRVLCARYGIGTKGERTSADLGRELGLSRQRIRQIEVAALRRVRDSDQSDTLRELIGR